MPAAAPWTIICFLLNARSALEFIRACGHDRRLESTERLMFRRVSLCLFISFFFVILPALAEDHTDVTTTVVAAVKDNKLSIAADNETSGNPVPGVVKKLHLKSPVGGAVQKREGPEGERMKTAAPAGQK